MKNFVIAIAVIGGIAAFASCSKDWTCTCTVNTTGFVTSTTTTDTTLTDMKKKDAQIKCDEGDGSFSAFGNTVTSECELK